MIVLPTRLISCAPRGTRASLRRATGAVDQRRALERDRGVAAGLARRRQQGAAEQGAEAQDARHGFGSLDVWSCRMYQRAPRFSSTSVNGPLAVIESPRISLKRAVQKARSGASRRTRTSSNVSESRVFPGAK